MQRLRFTTVSADLATKNQRRLDTRRQRSLTLPKAAIKLSAYSASLGTRSARRVRFPMGREPPQGAVTRLCVKNKTPNHGVTNETSDPLSLLPLRGHAICHAHGGGDRRGRAAGAGGHEGRDGRLAQRKENPRAGGGRGGRAREGRAGPGREVHPPRRRVRLLHARRRVRQGRVRARGGEEGDSGLEGLGRVRAHRQASSMHRG